MTLWTERCKREVQPLWDYQGSHLPEQVNPSQCSIQYSGLPYCQGCMCILHSSIRHHNYIIIICSFPVVCLVYTAWLLLCKDACVMVASVGGSRELGFIHTGFSSQLIYENQPKTSCHRHCILCTPTWLLHKTEFTHVRTNIQYMYNPPP